VISSVVPVGAIIFHLVDIVFEEYLLIVKFFSDNSDSILVRDDYQSVPYCSLKTRNRQTDDGI
jgi:hypothetical protein